MPDAATTLPDAPRCGYCGGACPGPCLRAAASRTDPHGLAAFLYARSQALLAEAGAHAAALAARPDLLDPCPAPDLAASPAHVTPGDGAAPLEAWTDGSGTVAHLACGCGVVIVEGGADVLAGLARLRAPRAGGGA